MLRDTPGTAITHTFETERYAGRPETIAAMRKALRGHLRRWQWMQMRVLTRMALQHIQGGLFSFNVARRHP